MRRLLILFAASFLLTACDADAGSDTLGDRALAGARGSAPVTLPTVLVYKSPTCDCCSGWVEHLEAAGFPVETRDMADVVGIKRDAGVPGMMSSCHTALVDGYVVEGHVPAEQIKQMLAERPDIAGIAVPGMPAGSPGMEGPNAQPYQVLSFRADGSSSLFATVDPR